MFMRIFAGIPWGGGVKQQCCCRQQQFSQLSLAMPSETSEIRPALLYGDTESLVGFSLIPKRMTLSGPERLFHVKFCFRDGTSSVPDATFENNCVKTNKVRPILSATQIFGRDFSFWQYKVYMDISGGSQERRSQRTMVSRVNARLELLFLAFENNCVK